MHTSQSHIGNGLSWGELLAPIRPDVFVTDYWQKKPLHISGRNTRCYSDAVTLETFHEIVTSGTLQHPALRLVRDGVEIRPHEFITEGIGAGGSASRPVDVGRVLVLYRTGATIVMPGMERYWPPLAHLCRSVERASSCGVQANAYLTPPAALGFAPHFDSHDVLVLQVSGTKRWLVATQASRARPLITDKCESASIDLKVDYVESDLAAGDLLYIPRGFSHQALTMADASLHVSLALKVTTYAEVLHDALETLAQRDEAFRTELPFGYATDEGAVADVPASLARLTSDVAGLVSARSFVRHLQTAFVATRRRHHYEWPADSAAADGRGGPVRLRPDLMVQLTRDGPRVVLTCSEGEFVFTTAMHDLLRRLSDGDPSDIVSLHAAGEDVTDREAIARMFSCDVLVMVRT